MVDGSADNIRSAATCESSRTSARRSSQPASQPAARTGRHAVEIGVLARRGKSRSAGAESERPDERRLPLYKPMDSTP
jgi:hypothetical protein